MTRIAAALACLLLAVCQSVRSEVTLGVHAEEPAPSIGDRLAELRPDDKVLALRAFDSSAQVLKALAAGEIDLGIVEDTGRQVPGVSLIAELYPSVLHILVRGPEAPGDIGELLRKGPIWAGPPGSIGYRLAENLARDFNVDASRLQLLADPWTVEPGIYFVFGGILSVEALSRLQGFRLYSLDAPTALMHGSVAEGIALRYPYLRPFTLPAQLYPSLGRPAALTLAVSNVLVGRSSLADELTYDLAMGVAHLAPQIAAGYPLAGLRQLVASTHNAQAIPLHPGAQHYRDRDLPGFFERYAELLGVAATLIIATGSLLVAWRRHRRQSRKDRLDGYYQQLLDLRQALSNGSPGDIQDQVKATQTEVMDLVIQERISTDGSLLAFLSLSNQLLAEAGVAATEQAARKAGGVTEADTSAQAT